MRGSVSHLANKEHKQNLSVYLFSVCELNVLSQTLDNLLPQQLSLLLSGCHSTSLPDNHLSYHLRPAVSHIR